jgi:anti-sigma regulatory factor (Ser/Thr protein kinase)
MCCLARGGAVSLEPRASLDENAEMDDTNRQAAPAVDGRALSTEFRGDVCVVRCPARRGGLAAGLREGLEHCSDVGVTQVVLDVDADATIGPDEVHVLVDAAERFRRRGGAVVLAVEDASARTTLAAAGLVRPPLPPPAEAAGIEPTVSLPRVPQWEHEFRVAATARSLPMARRRVAAFAEVGGLHDGDLFEFSVAVAEALANALVHGSPRGDGDEIRVRFYCYEDMVAVEVADAGAGLDATPICVPGATDIGGRGIHFMRALCDAVQFTCRPDGTHVLLVKRRR